jgi:osmotically-inducible protein OsmY
MRRAKALLVLAVFTASLAACFSDTGIRSRVERALAAHRELDLRAVTLDVHSRIVTLSGTVPTISDKRTIEQVVGAIPGIEQFVANLVVPE